MVVWGDGFGQLDILDRLVLGWAGRRYLRLLGEDGYLVQIEMLLAHTYIFSPEISLFIHFPSA